MLLCKTSLIVINCLLFSFVVINVTSEHESIHSLTGPLIVVGIFTSLVTDMILGVYDNSVNALLNCVAIDINANGGSNSIHLSGPYVFH